GRCEWLAMSEGFYLNEVVRYTIKTRRGENLGQFGVVELHRPWHDQIVLRRRAKGDVLVREIKQADQSRRDGVDLVVSDVACDEIAGNTSAEETTFQLFEAGFFAGNAENVFSGSGVALYDLAANPTELVSESDSTAGQSLHALKQAPEHRNTHSLECELTLAVDGHVRPAVTFG